MGLHTASRYRCTLTMLTRDLDVNYWTQPKRGLVSKA